PFGDAAGDRRFQLDVLFDPRGAGVRSIKLNKFQAADAQGLPVPDAVVELVPAEANTYDPSFVLYHCVRDSRGDEWPSDALGWAEWQLTEKKEETLPDGRRRQTIAFTAEVAGVRVTKRFSLTESEYHIGLEVELRRLPGYSGDGKFRYQLAGAHGLPIEGQWY